MANAEAEAAVEEEAAALADETTETAEDTTSSTCDQLAEQYAIALETYDLNNDGEFSLEELADFQSDYETQQVAQVDTDGDGAVSSTEKDAWASENKAPRAEKRKTKLNEACGYLGKAETECKALREARKDKRKAELEDRKGEFDTNGDGKIDKEEGKEMRDKLKKEQETRRDDRNKSFDTDGDGQVSEAEKNERHSARRAKRSEARGGGAKGGGEKTSGGGETAGGSAGGGEKSGGAEGGGAGGKGGK